MKTFFKTNLIGIFAVLLAVGTMSFKMLQKEELQTYWFAVDASTGEISSSPHTPGDECENNPTLDYFCSVAFNSPTLPISVGYITDTVPGGGTTPVAGVLYKEEDN